MTTTLKSQSDARKKILSDIKSKEKAVYSKRKQITSTRGKTKFPGVRVQDQFSVGRLGIEPFRERRISERKKGFSDLGIFNNQLTGLNSDLSKSRKSLSDFDAMPVLGL